MQSTKAYTIIWFLLVVFQNLNLHLQKQATTDCRLCLVVEGKPKLVTSNTLPGVWVVSGQGYIEKATEKHSI